MGSESGTGSSGSAARELGEVLRRCRLEQGLSFRVLARRLGMSAHSGLADYEQGRRIPPEDLIIAYESVFGLPAGQLKELRARAFAERADRRQSRAPRIATPVPPDNVRPPGGTADGDLLTSGKPAQRSWISRKTVAPLAAALLVVGVAVALVVTEPFQPARSRVGTSPTARSAVATPGRNGTPPGIDLGPQGVPVPVRRIGNVTIPAGGVIDLDSLSPDWGLRHAPQDNPFDLEFTLVQRSFTSIDNATMGVLPPGSAGTRLECGRLQAYGVDLVQSAMRPGAKFCVITDQHRIALLRIVSVLRDVTGVPYQVTLAVRVWQPPDTS
jgi:transcriptional regulator with XRE-family HTH domain